MSTDKSDKIKFAVISTLRDNERLVGVYDSQEIARKEILTLEENAHKGGRYMVGHGGYKGTQYSYCGPIFKIKVIFSNNGGNDVD